MKHLKNLTAITSAAILSTLPALAGESIGSTTEPASVNSFADTFKSIGTLYKNKDNPYIQKVKISGRYHYQAGSISGQDVDGNHYNDKFDIQRRARLDATVSFAQYFKVKIRTQLVSDSRYKGGQLQWGQPEVPWAAYDQVWLRFDAAKAFDLDVLDKLTFTYGRQKFLVGAETHASSSSIKTVERSALANTVYKGALPAGFTASATKGSWKVNASIYSDVLADNETNSIFGDWSGGQGYLVNVIKTLDNKDKVIVDAFYHNDTHETPAYNKGFGVDWFNNDWITSVSYLGNRGQWGFMGNVIVGDHTDDSKSTRGGLFYGFVTQGTYSFIEDKLEFVGQYQWQASKNSEGIRAYSKDFSSGGNRGHGGNINGGRGDMHHQLYGGLNYYIVGNNAKIMLGVEYDQLNTPEGWADGTTLWAAFRTKF